MKDDANHGARSNPIGAGKAGKEGTAIDAGSAQDLSAGAWSEEGVSSLGEESPAWTAEQVGSWRQTQVNMSPAALLWIQAAMSGGAVLLTGLVFGWFPVGVSAAWGWMSVVLPSGLMVWGLRRPAPQAGLGIARFFAWEWAKLGLSVVLMLLAPWGIEQWSGLALLAGVILAVKAHWLALWWLTRKSRGLETKNDLNTED